MPEHGSSSRLQQLWLLALAVAIGLYALWNPPIANAVRNLEPLALGAVFLAAFTGWGLLVVRAAARDLEPIDQLLAAAAIGQGLSALVVFALGLMHRLSPALFAVWTLAGLLVLAIAVARGFRPRLPSWREQPLDVLGAIVLALVLVQAVPFVTAPETTTDALEFHILVPKQYLVVGGIQYLPSFLESNYPSLAEYLYLLILTQADATACKALHFLNGMLVLVAIMRLGYRLGFGHSAWLAPALFLSMPVALTPFGWAWNDAIFTLFLLQMLTFLLRYHEADPDARSPGWLAWAGVMAGLASWTKYTFAMVFIVLALLFIVAVIRWRWRLSHLVRFYVPLGALSALWFFKNLAFTGNPFYPFLNGIFESPYWTAAADAYFKGTLTRYEMDWELATYFLFPFLIALKPRVIDVHTGVVPLLLVALLFLRSRSHGEVLLKWYVALYMLVWLFIQTEVRSFLSVLAVIALLGSIAIERHLWPRVELRRPLVVLLGAACIAGLVITVTTTYATFRPLTLFLGLEGRDDYLTREARHHQVYTWLDDQPDAGAVLLIGLHGPFYLERPAYFSSCCDPPIAEVLSANATSAADLVSTVRALGITHVVVDHHEWQREHRESLYSWSQAERARFERFLNEHVENVVSFDHSVIGRITSD